MSVFRKLLAIFHDDWCRECQNQMEEKSKKLYMLPMTVGHYVSHNDPEYYRKNLISVNRKSDIRVGNYACGIKVYRCPECLHELVKLSIFLPVRDQEKYEEVIYFENNELDGI